MTNAPEIFVQTVSEIDAGLELGNLFGKPCAKFSGGKPFLSFFQDDMVFKLGAKRCEELMNAHPLVQKFDPSQNNRPFKDWVQVPKVAGLNWIELGREAAKLNLAELNLQETKK